MSRTPPAKRRAEDNDAGPAKRILKCDNYRCSNGKNPVTAELGTRELGSPGGVDSALVSGNRADITPSLWARGRAIDWLPGRLLTVLHLKDVVSSSLSFLK